MKSFSLNFHAKFFYLAFLLFPYPAQYSLAENAAAAKHSTRVLLIHGLNHSIDNMKELETFFKSLGLSATSIRLFGHDTNSCKSIKSSPLGNWRSELDYKISKVQEDEIIIVGYSLGSLLALDALSRHTKISKLILFAPPVSLTVKTYFLRIILPLRVFNISLPSFAPTYSRVCPSTSLHFYAALFRLVDYLKSINIPTHQKTPVLVLFSENDKFVDSAGVKEWISDNKLDDWSLTQLDVTKPNIPEHLIVDREALGESQWLKLENSIKHFLGRYTCGH